MPRPNLAVACTLLAIAFETAARADSLASLPEPDYAADSHNVQLQPLPTAIREIAYPTIGCPAILAPGDELKPVVLLNDGGATTSWRAHLESARDPFIQTIPLALHASSFDAQTTTYRLTFGVPSTAPEDVYDLIVTRGKDPQPVTSDAQPNAVRVLRPHAHYEVVQLNDSQVRDPQARLPQDWPFVLSEIKLRDPAFIIYCGDLNFGADYSREYPENWSIMRAGALALACVPGNHDGYAWLATATAIDADGLYLWRRTIGPTYFSFRYDGIRYIGVNSFGGDAARRNSYTFLCANSGGNVEPTQLQWLTGEVHAAGAAGEEPILFMHHNPRPSIPLTPDVQGYPWNINTVGAASGTWGDAASRDAIAQLVAGQPTLRWVLAGHSHADDYVAEKAVGGAQMVSYMTTTSPCCTPHPTFGYRVMTVDHGTLSAPDYAPGQSSVPFPLGGNLAETFLDPNDGAHASVRVQVSSQLARDVDVTLKVFVPQDPRGYATTAGYIREVGLADAGPYVVYTRVTVPARSQVVVTISPDPGGQGARPASQGGSYNAGISAPPPGASPGGGGGGGGCRAATGSSDSLATWMLLIAGLAVVRFVRHPR